MQKKQASEKARATDNKEAKADKKATGKDEGVVEGEVVKE